MFLLVMPPREGGERQNSKSRYGWGLRLMDWQGSGKAKFLGEGPQVYLIILLIIHF
jgi:hypothetical protein